ncbi:MAG: 6-bladed beta-propeller [Gemmatimonadaceae bacterium]
MSERPFDARTPSQSTSRRAFLTSAASIGIAAAMPNLGSAAVLRSRSRIDETPLELGQGEFRYTMDHAWAKLPTGKRFGYTHGIVEDRAGRFYIANQSRDAVVVVDADGNYLSSWGQGYAPGAHGLHIAEENGTEYLYLANTGLGEVVKTTLDGDVVWKAGRPFLAGVYTPDRGYSPTETTLGPNGKLYVADGYGQSWIHIYDAKDGRYLDSFGGRGSEPHHLRQPHGISIDRRDGTPRVQVSDRGNVRVVDFSLEGRYLGEVITKQDLRFPCSTFHRGEHLYVPDLYARVSIFDKKNKKVADLGDFLEGGAFTGESQFGTTYPDLKGYPNIPHEKRRASRFISPHALWVDRRGNIYVVEWINDGRVTKLTKV